MGVPELYRRGGNVVASYDWLDLTSGVGYRKYYACASAINAATVFFLTPRILDSMPWIATAEIALTDFTLYIDKDFDITFNVPATIKGNAYINALFSMNGTIAGTTTAYVVVNIYHVRSTTETSIGTNTKQLERTISGDETKYWKECVEVVCSEKIFAVGDKLRINIQIYGKEASGNQTTLNLYFDPAGGASYTDVDGRTVTSDLVCDVPFKIVL